MKQTGRLKRLAHAARSPLRGENPAAHQEGRVKRPSVFRQHTATCGAASSHWRSQGSIHRSQLHLHCFRSNSISHNAFWFFILNDLNCYLPSKKQKKKLVPPLLGVRTRSRHKGLLIDTASFGLSDQEPLAQ